MKAKTQNTRVSPVLHEQEKKMEDFRASDDQIGVVGMENWDWTARKHDRN